MDSKVLKDLVGNDGEGQGGKVEFGVMVIGGAAALKKADSEEKEPEIKEMRKGGKEVLKTEEFWGDLKGYLVQRLSDEGEGERVWNVFRKAVEGGK